MNGPKQTACLAKGTSITRFGVHQSPDLVLSHFELPPDNSQTDGRTDKQYAIHSLAKITHRTGLLVRKRTIRELG